MSLKALSQNKNAGALARTLDFAQRYTAAVDFSDLDRAVSSSTEPTPLRIRMKPRPPASG
jgi:hypothetical protein